MENPRGGFGGQLPEATVTLKRITLPLAAFDTGTGEAPVYTLSTNEILLGAFLRVLVAFDDSTAGDVNLQDASKTADLSVAVDSTALPTAAGGMVGLVDGTNQGFGVDQAKPIQANEPDSANVDIIAVVQTFAGDGAVGTLEVLLLLAAA
jgi:hypothetical protein